MSSTLPQPGGGSLELAIELARLREVLCDQGEMLVTLTREHAAMAKMFGLRGAAPQSPAPADGSEGIPAAYSDWVAERVRARRRRRRESGLRAV